MRLDLRRHTATERCTRDSRAASCPVSADRKRLRADCVALRRCASVREPPRSVSRRAQRFNPRNRTICPHGCTRHCRREVECPHSCPFSLTRGGRRPTLKEIDGSRRYRISASGGVQPRWHARANCSIWIRLASCCRLRLTQALAWRKRLRAKRGRPAEPALAVAALRVKRDPLAKPPSVRSAGLGVEAFSPGYHARMTKPLMPLLRPRAGADRSSADARSAGSSRPGARSP